MRSLKTYRSVNMTHIPRPLGLALRPIVFAICLPLVSLISPSLGAKEVVEMAPPVLLQLPRENQEFFESKGIKAEEVAKGTPVALTSLNRDGSMAFTLEAQGKTYKVTFPKDTVEDWMKLSSDQLKPKMRAALSEVLVKLTSKVEDKSVEIGVGPSLEELARRQSTVVPVKTAHGGSIDLFIGADGATDLVLHTISFKITEAVVDEIPNLSTLKDQTFSVNLKISRSWWNGEDDSLALVKGRILDVLGALVVPSKETMIYRGNFENLMRISNPKWEEEVRGMFKAEEKSVGTGKKAAAVEVKARAPEKFEPKKIESKTIRTTDGANLFFGMATDEDASLAFNQIIRLGNDQTFAVNCYFGSAWKDSVLESITDSTGRAYSRSQQDAIPSQSIVDAVKQRIEAMITSGFPEGMSNEQKIFIKETLASEYGPINYILTRVFGKKEISLPKAPSLKTQEPTKQFEEFPELAFSLNARGEQKLSEPIVWDGNVAGTITRLTFTFTDIWVPSICDGLLSSDRFKTEGTLADWSDQSQLINAIKKKLSDRMNIELGVDPNKIKILAALNIPNGAFQKIAEQLLQKTPFIGRTTEFAKKRQRDASAQAEATEASRIVSRGLNTSSIELTFGGAGAKDLSPSRLSFKVTVKDTVFERTGDQTIPVNLNLSKAWLKAQGDDLSAIRTEVQKQIRARLIELAGAMRITVPHSEMASIMAQSGIQWDTLRTRLTAEVSGDVPKIRTFNSSSISETFGSKGAFITINTSLPISVTYETNVRGKSKEIPVEVGTVELNLKIYSDGWTGTSEEKEKKLDEFRKIVTREVYDRVLKSLTSSWGEGESASKPAKACRSGVAKSLASKFVVADIDSELSQAVLAKKSVALTSTFGSGASILEYALTITDFPTRGQRTPVTVTVNRGAVDEARAAVRADLATGEKIRDGAVIKKLSDAIGLDFKRQLMVAGFEGELLRQSYDFLLSDVIPDISKKALANYKEK